MDFAINAPYDEASERFEMHYGRSLSTHYLRCMVERLPLPDFESVTPSPAWKKEDRITVQIDGCLLPLTAGWKEAKLGVVFNDDHHRRGGQNDNARGQITQARYVATMGCGTTPTIATA